MFYSETLLAKNGPLARVWLASNLEKKLSKQNILSEQLDTKVKDIIGSGQAPIALRLSGQLLLGVVRIYSRKARYLLDDAQEALNKIKMAFRPGNVDLPSNQSHTANPNLLMLPDTITDLDLFAPLPDPEDLLREPESRGPGRDPTLLDFGTQLLPESQTPSKRQDRTLLLDDDDLGLDLGLEAGEDLLRSTPFGADSIDRSIEVGRRAPTPRRDEPSLLLDDDLGLDLGLEDTTILARPNDDDMPMLQDDDLPMGGMELDLHDDVAAANDAAFRRVEAAAEARQRERDSMSPLSDISEARAQDLERTFQLNQSSLHHQEEEEDEEEDDETIAQAAQRVKRRRVMKADTETELHNSTIRAQQNDRSGITKIPEFLPRDPVLLQLMEMQRKGTFVSNLMGDGSLSGLAPELRGILSLEVVRRTGEARKRKRDSGVADLNAGEGSEREGTPRLEIPELEGEEDEGFQAGAGADFGDRTLRSDGGLLMSDGFQPAADEEQPLQHDEEEVEDYPQAEPFDTTEAPLLHPSQTGPVSLGTKNAVFLLREHFAPSHPTNSTSPPSPSKRVKAECTFEELCPVARTSRQDATKMFFELLVLGTKDAVKVEQGSGELGLPIRVRGKRGLWGDWAAREAGGEIAAQQEGEEVVADA